MKNWNTRQNRITILFLLLFSVAITLWFIMERDTGYNTVLGIVQTTIYTGLISTWCILFRHRVIQRSVNRHITAVCLFMILWILLRGLKYYIFPPGTDVARYLWYAYYIPMMFYSTCAILAMSYVGRPEQWELPRKTYIIFIIPVVISILILTNDFHQLAFTFPTDAEVWSDFDYGYGPLYVLPFSWFMLCTLFTLGVLIKRSRYVKTRFLATHALIIPPFLGLCYSIAYVTGYPLHFRDIIVTMCFFTVCTFEVAIRLGHIRSNVNYVDAFQRSSVAAQIFDHDRNLRYISGAVFPYDEEVMTNALRDGSYTEGNTRYVSAPLRDGYVIWKEDLSEILDLQRQLESANTYLEDHNLILHDSNESKIRRKKLEERNRLYNAMQEQTADELQKIEELLTEFEQASVEKERDILLQLGLLTVYLKRRNNLLFLAEDSDRIPASELTHCFRESVKVLETFGVNCSVRMEVEEAMSFQKMVTFYDAFQLLLEETVLSYPVYYVSLTGDASVLRIRLAGVEGISNRVSSAFRILEQEEEEFLMEVRTDEV